MVMYKCEKAVCKMNTIRILALIKDRDKWKKAFMDKENEMEDMKLECKACGQAQDSP